MMNIIRATIISHHIIWFTDLSPLVTFTLIKLLADNLTLSVSVLLHDDGDEVD